MPPDTALSEPALIRSDRVAASTLDEPTVGKARVNDSLFEQFDWLYILCREKLFRDDTDRIIAALWPNGGPAPGTRLIELGCGPGFYSRQLAQRFPELEVIGIDQSRGQIAYARRKTGALGLTNVRFEQGDANTPVRPDSSIDVVMASRLLTVLQRRHAAIAETFRVLKPGGKLFIAEPRFGLWASIPLLMMWVVAIVTGKASGYKEPRTASVFTPAQLEDLVRTQPWRSVRVWLDGRYEYALCEKA